MALLMTGLSGISKFLGTHEKQVKHTSASFKYTQISMNIDTVLSFPRNEREENPRQFINDIKISILEVREHSPDIPTWIVDNYIKKLDKTITNTITRVNKRKSIQFLDSPSRTPNNTWAANYSNNNEHEKKQIVVFHPDTSIEMPDFEDNNKTNTICLLSSKLEREESDVELQSADEI